MQHKISIQTEDFDLNQEMQRFQQDQIGAVVNFIGFVRSTADIPVISITLEHYPKMSEKSLTKIANLAQKRWKTEAITIIHRVGKLPKNAQIVLVITSSQHRQSAFEACQFIIDYLKTDAPFWKKQQTKTATKWLKTKKTDQSQKTKWQS